MSTMESTLIFFGISHKGLQREKNEDHFIVADLTRKAVSVHDNSVSMDLICHKIGEDGSIVAVADGLGGHERGEVASQIAVEATVEALFGTSSNYLCTTEWLAAAVEQAHIAICKRSGKSQISRGMGSTLTAIHIGDGVMSIAQVGDSRAYAFRNKKLIRLTEDQTLVDVLKKRGVLTESQAKSHPSKHVILQSLGQDKVIVPIFYSYNLYDGDYILLCTDGLSSYVHHDTIESILSSGEGEDILCQRLVDAANAVGGFDNVTVLLARFKKQWSATSCNSINIDDSMIPNGI